MTIPASGSQSVGFDVPSQPWAKSYPADIRWDQEIPTGPVFKLLDNAATEFPNNPCTNFLGRVQTYSEIADKVDKVAAALQSLGVKPKTKVGLFLPNCPTFIVYYYAILKVGGVVVNYNPLYAVEELSFQAKDSQTEIMVTLDLKLLFEKVEALVSEGALKQVIVASFPALLPSTKSVLFKLFKSKELVKPKNSTAGHAVILEGELLERGTADLNSVTIDPTNDVAVLQYTGGTTGTPKAAMLTHANLYTNAMQIAAWAPDLKPGTERVLGVLPFFHVFAMTVVMNYSIANAAEIIIMPRFVLDDALKLMNSTRPTVMPGVPTLFNAIMNHKKLKNFDLSSLKFCLSGGAALPIEVKQQFESLTGCKLVEGYGLSESSPVVTCNPLEGPVHEGSIGLPLPQTRVSLRDLSDPTKEVPHGEKGELCVAGPQVMKGYWQKPEETDNVFVGEFLRTGDVARMDDDGFLRIEDRIKDLIICSGYNVYPRQIEEAIYTHPAVEEVTVIGIRDDYRGEAPKAFVKLHPGQNLNADELLAHLETKLSKIEMPAEIEFRDELPKTMIGKLSKKELKAEEEKRRSQT